MLVISVLLILRDMAKTILTGRMSKKEEIFPIGEDHPQKEKVERYAAAFQKLADTFYGMPYKKEYLSSGQIERILTDANDRLCSNCYHREICWGSQAETMCQGGEALVRALEKDDEGELEKLRMQWGSVCGKSLQYLEEVREQFRQEKQNLIWMNRMIESRLAVAQQLTETAAIMETVANDLYDISAAEPEFQEELKKNLRRKHVILKAAWVMDKVEGRRQIFLTLRARSGQCVSVTEVAQMLSELCESNMTRKINDATMEDAQDIGLTELTTVIGNGNEVGGTWLPHISSEAREALESADLIIAKGQGNYETLHDCGLNIYYLFLCKCKWFQYQFNAKPLQGMFINERRI